MSYLTDIGPLSAITIKSYYQANKAHKDVRYEEMAVCILALAVQYPS